MYNIEEKAKFKELQNKFPHIFSKNNRKIIHFINNNMKKQLIIKSPLKYTGSKYYYIKTLRPYFSKYNDDTLLDVFGGSGTITLNFQ